MIRNTRHVVMKGIKAKLTILKRLGVETWVGTRTIVDVLVFFEAECTNHTSEGGGAAMAVTGGLLWAHVDGACFDDLVVSMQSSSFQLNDH